MLRLGRMEIAVLVSFAVLAAAAYRFRSCGRCKPLERPGKVVKHRPEANAVAERIGRGDPGQDI
jgi:hypothetical protein